MKFWVILLFLGFGFCANAQEIKVNGTTYEVKGKIILKDGVDVTNTLTIEQQNEIRSSLEKKLKVEKEAKKAEKAQNKAEKAQKKAEKEQKRAEKALKKKEKAQDRYERAGEKYKDAQKKYERLKSKGKLSPQDEAKWLEKLEDLKEDIEKAKKKM